MKRKPSNNRETCDQQLKSSLNFPETKTDRLTVFIMNVFGSISFLIFCVLFFIIWALWNLNLLPGLEPFDPYPFPLLEMAVSLFAIVLSVTVIINQNRKGRIDKISSQVEFEVNIRAEEEITKILNMLHEIQQHLGVEISNDNELEKMKEPTDINRIHKKLDEDKTENLN
ncbi:DUF1003 domain-containing protein [Taibaiella lutea]|nr:DUF1003 domain-containing protein [Taibaiella lutea]